MKPQQDAQDSLPRCHVHGSGAQNDANGSGGVFVHGDEFTVFVQEGARVLVERHLAERDLRAF